MRRRDAGVSPETVAPEPGDTIVIRWPGHPDIRMRFEGVDPIMPAPSPGWEWLHGEILEGLATTGGWRWQTLYARPVEPGIWQMVDVRR